jgi:hypothetical protein
MTRLQTLMRSKALRRVAPAAFVIVAGVGLTACGSSGASGGAGGHHTTTTTPSSGGGAY